MVTPQQNAIDQAQVNEMNAQAQDSMAQTASRQLANQQAQRLLQNQQAMGQAYKTLISKVQQNNGTLPNTAIPAAPNQTDASASAAPTSDQGGTAGGSSNSGDNFDGSG